MATNPDPTPGEIAEPKELGIDDPSPFPGWLPSPEQIARWSKQIREENEEARRDENGRHHSERELITVNPLATLPADMTKPF